MKRVIDKPGFNNRLQEIVETREHQKHVRDEEKTKRLRIVKVKSELVSRCK